MCAASPHAPLTRSAVRLYPTCHTPQFSSRGLCRMLTPPCQTQPLPTTHASPFPVSPAGQPLGTTAKPSPPDHATTLCSCTTAPALCAPALTRHRQPPPHNFTSHTDPTRHLKHTDHIKAMCCSLLQALCFSLVLMLFNSSLCFHFSHVTYVFIQCLKSTWAICKGKKHGVKGYMMIPSVFPSMTVFKG